MTCKSARTHAQTQHALQVREHKLQQTIYWSESLSVYAGWKWHVPAKHSLLSMFMPDVSYCLSQLCFNLSPAVTARLMGGSTPQQGRLEVLQKGLWSESSWALHSRACGCSNKALLQTFGPFELCYPMLHLHALLCCPMHPLQGLCATMGVTQAWQP